MLSTKSSLTLSHSRDKKLSVKRSRATALALILGAATTVLAACSTATPGEGLTGSPLDPQSNLVGQTVDLGLGGEQVTVGLTYVPNVQFAPVYVAGTDEIFRAAGIGVSIRHHGADEGLFTALVSGEEDVTVASGDEVLQARAAGMDLVSIGAYYHQYPVVIVTKEDSGIKTIEDLRGKKVGLPGEFGSNWFGLLAALDGAGMSTADVKVTSIGFTQAASLASDQVDAIVGFINSDVVQLQQLGVPITVIPLTEGEPPLVGASIVTTTKWLANNPGLAAGVVGSITAGAERVLLNPQHALEVTTLWDPALSDSQTRAGATKILEATLPLWKDKDGSAAATQDLVTWQAMGAFLGPILDSDITPEDVDKAVTNSAAQ